MKRIGIDAGGSLIKIAYEEDGRFHYWKYPLHEVQQLTNWLKMTAPEAKIYATGGKSGLIQSLLPDVILVDEFLSIAEGVRFFLKKEMRKTRERFILANIGTGTSIFYIHEGRYERITGTGIGGGTLLGLGHLLGGEKNFYHLVEMADKGNRKKVDMLVKDIYEQTRSPVASELTAANFGKAILSNDYSRSDCLAALCQMIGETIFQMASLAAELKHVDTLVFTGSTLDGNGVLKNLIGKFCEMNSYEVIFPEHGSYCGAIGAILAG